MTSIQQIEQAFAAVPALAALSPSQRRRLAMQAKTHSFPAGSVILREGDTSLALYVMLSGAARVERAAGSAGSLALNELRPGAVFGEMGMIDGAPRSATVTAVERTECALLSRWDFDEPLRDNSEIGLVLLRTLSARVRRLEARLAQQSSPPAARPALQRCA